MLSRLTAMLLGFALTSSCDEQLKEKQTQDRLGVETVGTTKVSQDTESPAQEKKSVVGKERSSSSSRSKLIAFTSHIQPLVEKYCIDCHGEGGSDPKLTSFEEVKASRAVGAVAEGRMPLGKSMTPDESELFLKWRDGGYLDFYGDRSPRKSVIKEPSDQKKDDDTSLERSSKQGSEEDFDDGEGHPENDLVYYVSDIEPLLERYRCVSCHARGAQDPDLSTYDLVKASDAVDSILTERMPIGRKVSEIDQALFDAWRKGGYLFERPEGNDAPDSNMKAEVEPREPSDQKKNDHEDQREEPPIAPEEGEKVTYTDHVRPLLAKYNCTLCHSAGANPPELTTYDLVKDSGSVESVESGAMPRGSTMSPEDVDIFLRWKEGGYLESLGGQEPDVQCNNDAVPETGFRRLSSNEYKNSLMAVSRLALDGIDFTNHPADPVLGVFSNDRSKLMTTRDHKEYYMSVGEEVAALMVQSSSAIPDNCRTVNTDGCIDQLIPSVASDAYRRPVGADEITEIKGIYTTISDEFGHAKGLEAILEVILSSPNFIYRTELGEGGSQNGLVVLGPYEIASQLSYMLIGSPPDAALLADAKNGGINDAAVRISHAQRLMASEAFLDQGLSFMDQWLGLNKIEGMSKDMDMFPEFTSSLKAAYRTETSLFIRDMFANLGSPKSILTADYAFLNPMLKQHYGLPGGGTNEFVRTSLAGTSRSGLLTQGSFASIYAHQNETSPIFRGTKISTKLLCIKLPDPPSDIEPLSSAANSVLTTRERVAAHSSDPSCRGCHQIIDPLGFSLEGFDSIGKARTVDNNLPVDSSGTVKVGDEEITFDSYKSLASRIADNPEYNTCFTDQMMRFSLGSYSTQKNSCYINEVTTSWQSSGGSVKELLISIIGSDYFSMRKSN